MSRLAKWLLAGVLVVGLLGVVLYLELLGPPEVVWQSEIRKGDRLVSEIEAFQRNRGRLPAQLSEISDRSTDKEQLFYQRCNETRYIVWFGTTLGESMTYKFTVTPLDRHKRHLPIAVE